MKVHRCAEKGTIDKDEWVEFLHTKVCPTCVLSLLLFKFYSQDKIFTDWDEVRREIEKETDRMAGSNKVTCHLNYYFPTKVPVIRESAQRRYH